MLNDYLQKLGFNDKEIAIYVTIVEHGKLSAAAITKLTKINRTTVYSVSKELIKKGVIQEDLGGLNRYFSAAPIEELRSLYERQEEELTKKKGIVEEAIRELDALPKSKKYSVPKIRFIDELRLRDFLFKQLPVWIESAKNNSDKNWWGFQDASLIKAYPDWFKYHWEIFPENYGNFLLTNRKPAEEDFARQVANNHRRQVKYWAESKDFTATNAILGDYILFVVTSEHPYYLIEINDAVMAENLRGIFKGIWDKV